MNRNDAIKRITAILDDADGEDIMLLPIYETVDVLKDTLVLLKSEKQERPVITCAECKHWDPDSGLTARKCLLNKLFTTQHEWCSRAVRRTGDA